MNVVLDGNTATNKNTGQTYTYGKRGRKPLWVQDFENTGAVQVPAHKNKNLALKEVQHKGPFEWHFKTESNHRCVIVADNDLDAQRVANKVFKYPVSGKELALSWQRKPHFDDTVFTKGIWRFDTMNNQWEEYRKRA